ncbi:MAG TPA: dipeptidase [Gemmatimonadales bacterium]|nr:dipeptidase [Gemmatimonadales bacterium]
MLRNTLRAALCAAPLVLAPAAAAQVPDSSYIRRALELHRQVPMVDGHNDLPWELRVRYRGNLDSINLRDPQPHLHTDLPRLRAGAVGAQLWSIWIPDTMVRYGPARLMLEQLDLARRMVARYPASFENAASAADIERIHRSGRIAAMYGLEGGHAIENSLALIRLYHSLGVRYMTLTWNNSTAWADAAADTARRRGLTPFGREVVREMNRTGMLVDLSHVSDSVMIQALRVSEAPVIFSHSSARALADHRRNVPDTVLRLVRANRGVVMVNFYCSFIDSATIRWSRQSSQVRADLRTRFAGDSVAAAAAFRQWLAVNPRPARPGLRLMADHIEHIRRVAGVDHVAYGSDYDGIDCAPEGLEDVSTFPRLTAELLRRGWSDDDVRKVIGLNFLRVLREAEQVAARLQQSREPSTATIGQLDSSSTTGGGGSVDIGALEFSSGPGPGRDASPDAARALAGRWWLRARATRNPAVGRVETPLTLTADRAPVPDTSRYAGEIVMAGFVRMQRNNRGRPAVWWPVAGDSLVIRFTSDRGQWLELRGRQEGQLLRGDVWYLSETTGRPQYQLGTFEMRRRP